jgi:predicted ester cyclase
MPDVDMKQKSRDFVEQAWSRGDFSRIDEFLTEDYLEHRPEGTVEGVEGMRQLVSMMRQAYPDLRVELHHVVADDKFLACTYTVEGTMQGDLGELKATGKAISLEGMYMGRIEGERMAEGWNRFDLLSMMMQLGFISPEAGAPDLAAVLASQQPSPPA